MMFSMLASKGVGVRTSGGGGGGGGGALRAFPGAEGVGTLTRGGSGGTVYIVNTLANSGTGSFREACEASGARIVIFTVTGIIDLTSELLISNPNLTVYGQTSPGGIIVSGYRVTVNTNDVIFQHVRFRTGTHNNGGTAEYSRSFQVNGDGDSYPNAAYNVVVDHCSFAWGTDQTVTVQEDAYDVTISWCYITEAHDNGASNHGYSMFFWGRYTTAGRQYSVHHCYLANSRFRNPEINFRGSLDFRNNVVYNPVRGSALNVQYDTYTEDKTGIDINCVGNYLKHGPDTSDTHKDMIDFYEYGNDPGTEAKVYLSNNISPHRTASDAETFAVTATDSSPFNFWEGYTAQDVDAGFVTGTEYTFDETVTTSTMNLAYAQTVIDGAGATVPVRDSIDTQNHDDFDNDTGRIIETRTYDTDWPDLVTGAPSPPTDTNSDGIPDDYEVYKGYSAGALSPSGTAPSGYTWIEEYANDLAAGNWSIT